MKILIALSIVVGTGIVLIILTIFTVPDLNPTSSEIILKAETGDEKLFVQIKDWGVVGNRREIIVSQNLLETNKDSSDNFIQINGLLPVIYRFEHDTLNIYTQNIISFPNNFKSGVKVVCHKVENARMNYFLDNMQSLKLSEF